MLEDMRVFHKTYEFMKWLHTLLNKFPKAEKYTLGQRIENAALGVLEGIIQSNNDFDKTESLKKTIVELDKLRIYLRMAKDFQYVSFRQYEYGSSQLNEIGRMLGGWYKKFSPPSGGGASKNEHFMVLYMGWVGPVRDPGLCRATVRQLEQWGECRALRPEPEQRSGEPEQQHWVPLLQQFFEPEPSSPRRGGQRIMGNYIGPLPGCYATEYKTERPAVSSLSKPAGFHNQ